MNAPLHHPRLYALLITAALWPIFGGADDSAGKTLESLRGQTVQLPKDIPISDAERLARENYRKFLQLYGTDPKLAVEALRRLGDLELEAGENQDLNRGVDKLGAGTYATAVALYKHLLKRYPDYPRNDLVLYQLGRAEESSGEALTALATLDELVAKYPHTPILDEVQFRRGEILFSRQRYAEAENAYAAVLALKKDGEQPGEYYEQSLYKHGWSQFKQDRYEDGLGSFFKLLDGRVGNTPAADVDKKMEALSRPQRELVDDTLRVMSMSLSYLSGEKSLRQALQQHGDPEYGHLLYLSLSSLYLEQKRYADAATVLSGFVEAQPQHPRAPYLYMQAVACLEQGKFPSEVLTAREGYVNRFGLDQAFWKAHAPADNAPAVDFLRDSVWILAQHYHAQAQVKEQTPPEREQNYRLAAQWYRRYLAYFPQDAKAPESQFLLGEALFQIGDDAGAVEAYNAAAYRYPAHAHSTEAGYAELVAYQRHEAALDGDARTAWHRANLGAQIHFADTFPDDKRAVTVRLNAAQGLYAIGALPETIAAATPITTTAGATVEQKRAAWLVIGQSNFDSKQYANAETAYVQARHLDEASGKRDADLSERIAASIYRQGEEARSAGQATQAAAAFMRVGQVVPDSKIRTTADYDAAQTLLSAGQTAAAIPIMQTFRQLHPDSPLTDAVSANLALAFVQTNDTASAAQEFERIADNKRVSDAEREEALMQATKLHAQRKDANAEARTLILFVQRYPTDFNKSLEAQQRLIELAGERHDATARLDLCKRLIAYDAAAGAKRTPRSRYLAARATLALAEPVRDAFLAIPLNAPLKESLKRKKARMEEALALYGKAADYGAADVITEATFQLGDIYNGLAKALYASERPKGLDADAREQYDTLLQEQAFPFEEKAIALHEANVKRAHDGIYDEWVKRSYASLAALVPGRYARPDKGETYVEALR